MKFFVNGRICSSSAECDEKFLLKFWILAAKTVEKECENKLILYKKLSKQNTDFSQCWKNGHFPWKMTKLRKLKMPGAKAPAEMVRNRMLALTKCIEPSSVVNKPKSICLSSYKQTVSTCSSCASFEWHTGKTSISSWCFTGFMLDFNESSLNRKLLNIWTLLFVGHMLLHFRL